jgi:hypothetical protein
MPVVLKRPQRSMPARTGARERQGACGRSDYFNHHSELKFGVIAAGCKSSVPVPVFQSALRTEVRSGVPFPEMVRKHIMFQSALRTEIRSDTAGGGKVNLTQMFQSTLRCAPSVQSIVISRLAPLWNCSDFAIFEG